MGKQQPERKRWMVRFAEQPGVVVEAIACEFQSGALLFWDRGLVRAFGAGAWTDVEQLKPDAGEAP